METFTSGLTGYVANLSTNSATARWEFYVEVVLYSALSLSCPVGRYLQGLRLFDDAVSVKFATTLNPAI
jgi:hypothetical protein